MKNKNMTILLIIFLGLMAIVVITLLVFLLLGKGSGLFTFETESALLLDEKYDSNIRTISIESISSDVIIKEAEENQIQVLIYGNNKEIAESKVEEENLKISKKGRYFCFGFCTFKDDIIVYVPKEIKVNLEIKTTSGDVEGMSLPNGNVNVKTTSGDIKVGEVTSAKIQSTSGEVTLEKVNDGEINTTSGDIKINKVEKAIDASSISGDIFIGDLKLEEDGTIKTTSGDVVINKIADTYIETSTVSGDINISDNNRYASHTLKIKTTSGDIKAK